MKFLPLLLILVALLFDSFESYRFTVHKSKLFKDTSIRTFSSNDEIKKFESLQTVEETWNQLEDFGATLTRYTSSSLFLRALSAGVFVGFGGILSASVGTDMGKVVGAAGSGWERFLSGAIGFPLSIILVSLTGNGAWTGDMLLVARSFLKKRSSLKSCLRLALITWSGCFAGTILAALLTAGAQLPACGPILQLAAYRMKLTNLQIFLRGIGGGALICLAIFLQKMNKDMAGKVLAIWFPISTYVIVGFEHVLASMFFLSCAKLNGMNITIAQILRYLVPSTLGNLIGGGLLVGLGLGSLPGSIRERKSVSMY